MEAVVLGDVAGGDGMLSSHATEAIRRGALQWLAERVAQVAHDGLFQVTAGLSLHRSFGP